MTERICSTKLIYYKFMFNSQEIAHVDMQLLQQFKILINFWRQIFLKVADILTMILSYHISIIASTLWVDILFAKLTKVNTYSNYSRMKLTACIFFLKVVCLLSSLYGQAARFSLIPGLLFYFLEEVVFVW